MMKTIYDYIAEESQRAAGPVVGDQFAINLREDCLLETHVIDTTDDGFVVAADDLFMSLLETYGCTTEEIKRYGPVGANAAQGYTVAEQDVDKNNSDAELQLIRSRAGVAENDYDDDDKDPPFDADDEPSSDKDQFGNIIKNKAQHLARKGMQQAKDVKEAEYQGRKVELNKPMSGDVKKSKVYVKDPKTGNVKKVNFGDPNMRIKKSNPERRKSFRARHNCDNPGPKTKARYWSCRAW
jgi:hypothetical protein